MGGGGQGGAAATAAAVRGERRSTRPAAGVPQGPLRCMTDRVDGADAADVAAALAPAGGPHASRAGRDVEYADGRSSDRASRRRAAGGVRIVTAEGRKGGGKGLRQEGAAAVRHAGTRASGGGSGNGEKGRGGEERDGLGRNGGGRFSGREQAGDEVGVEDERSQTASRLNSGRGGWRG